MKNILLIILLLLTQFVIAQPHPKIAALSKRITAGAKNDTEKARAIHFWIAKHIKYSGKLTGQLPIQTLKTRLGVCQDIAELFVEMCKSVNIPAAVVVGYVKSDDYIPSMPFYWEEHAWNAFKAEGEWHLSDVTWDCNRKKRAYDVLMSIFFKKKYKKIFPVWFDRAPDRMKKHHLPVYEGWQLSYFPNLLKNFEQDTFPQIYSDSSHICDFPQQIQTWENTTEMRLPLLEAQEAVINNPRNHKIVMENWGGYGLELMQKYVFEDKVFRQNKRGYVKMKREYRRKQSILVAMVKSKPAETKTSIYYLDSAYIAARKTLTDARKEYNLKRQKWNVRHQFLARAQGKRSRLRISLVNWSARYAHLCKQEKRRAVGKKDLIQRVFEVRIADNRWYKVKQSPVLKEEVVQTCKAKIGENQLKIAGLKESYSALLDTVQLLEANIQSKRDSITQNLKMLSVICESNQYFNWITRSFFLAQNMEKTSLSFENTLINLQKSSNQTLQKLKTYYRKADYLYQSCYALHYLNKSYCMQAAPFSAIPATQKEEYEAEIEMGRADLAEWTVENKRREAEMMQFYAKFRHLKSKSRQLYWANWWEITVEKYHFWVIKRDWGKKDILFRRHITSWARMTGRTSKWLKRLQKLAEKK